MRTSATHWALKSTLAWIGVAMVACATGGGDEEDGGGPDASVEEGGVGDGSAADGAMTDASDDAGPDAGQGDGAVDGSTDADVDAGDGGETDAGRYTYVCQPTVDDETACTIQLGDCCDFPAAAGVGAESGEDDHCFGSRGDLYEVECWNLGSKSAYCRCTVSETEKEVSACVPTANAVPDACNPTGDECCGFPEPDEPTGVGGGDTVCGSQWRNGNHAYRVDCDGLTTDAASCACTELSWGP